MQTSFQSATQNQLPSPLCTFLTDCSVANGSPTEIQNTIIISS